MPTIDTDLYDALTAANVPADKARAAAAALERRLSAAQVDLVTNAELGAAVDRLETQIAVARSELGAEIKALSVKVDRVEERLDARISGEVGRLDARISALDAKVDARFDNLSIQITMIKWFMGMQVAVLLGMLWALLRIAR